jgi:hypothetical protein
MKLRKSRIFPNLDAPPDGGLNISQCHFQLIDDPVVLGCHGFPVSVDRIRRAAS